MLIKCCIILLPVFLFSTSDVYGFTMGVEIESKNCKIAYYGEDQLKINDEKYSVCKFGKYSNIYYTSDLDTVPWKNVSPESLDSFEVYIDNTHKGTRYLEFVTNTFSSPGELINNLTKMYYHHERNKLIHIKEYKNWGLFCRNANKKYDQMKGKYLIRYDCGNKSLFTSDYSPQATIDIPVSNVLKFLNANYPFKKNTFELKLGLAITQLPQDANDSVKGFILYLARYIDDMTHYNYSNPLENYPKAAHSLLLRTKWNSYYSSLNISRDLLIKTLKIIFDESIENKYIYGPNYKVKDFLDYVTNGKQFWEDKYNEVYNEICGYMELTNNIVVEIRNIRRGSAWEPNPYNLKDAIAEFYSIGLWLDMFEKGIVANYFMLGDKYEKNTIEEIIKIVEAEYAKNIPKNSPDKGQYSIGVSSNVKSDIEKEKEVKKDE